MKQLMLFVLVAWFGASSCSNGDAAPAVDVEYPIRTELAEHEFVGEMSVQPMPPTTVPPLPGVVVGLSTGEDEYICVLGGKSHLSYPIIMEELNLTLFEGDRVRVTGTAYEIQHSADTRVYRQIEVETVEVLERGDTAAFPVRNELAATKYTGVMSIQPLPPTTVPPLPGVMVGLSTEDGEYVCYLHNKAYDGFPVSIAAQGITLNEGDRVSIIGTAYEEQFSPDTRVYRSIYATTVKLLEEGGEGR